MLKDRIVVITGAARGIGQATAKLFSKEGAKLFLSDLDKEPLDKTINEIKNIVLGFLPEKKTVRVRGFMHRDCQNKMG